MNILMPTTRDIPDSPAYDKLYDHGESGVTYCIDASQPQNPEDRLIRGLFYEPSFQLYKVKTWNTDFPQDYQIQENFYYWDLANDPIYQRHEDPNNCIPFSVGDNDPPYQ